MKKILIIKLGAVGDVVHTLPVLETLRACFPEARIGWAVEESAAPILKGNPDLDELILLERRKLRGLSAVSYFRQWLRALRTRRFDAVIDPHNLFKSGLIAYASGASVRIGFRKLREGNFLFMNRWVKPRAGHRHAVEKNLSLLEPLGIQQAQWVLRFPLFWSSEDEARIDRFWAQQGLNPSDPIVAVNPGASWPSKRWPPERYARAADRLAARGVRVVIVWGPGERPLAGAVAGAMTEKTVVACETDLKSLMALLKRCRLLISGDTGPLHIAAALGIPTVALFGPSDSERNGPYGKGHRVIRSSVSPANHWQTKEKGTHWMEGIPVESVVGAVLEQLGM